MLAVAALGSSLTFARATDLSENKTFGGEFASVVGSVGLDYDGCARAGFAEPIQPSAEERFETLIATLEREPAPPGKEDVREIAEGMRQAWDGLKAHRRGNPAQYTADFCSTTRAEFEKVRVWYRELHSPSPTGPRAN